MNARTKAATRKATRNNRTVGVSVPSNQQGVEVSAPANHESGAKTEPTKLKCVNPACKVEITPLNKYGSFNGGYVCSQRCDDAVDPVSKMVREKNSQLPSCDSISHRSPE